MHPEEDEHTSLIRTPKQLITVVVLSLAISVLTIILLSVFVVTADRTGAGSDAMTPEAITERIKPVAGLVLRDASTPQVARGGEEVFKAVCSACHAAGVAGAPKVGDKGAWEPRIASGLETLVASALKGKGAMPPQGGGDFSDAEITKGVVYMTNASGATFEEPKSSSPAPAAQAEGGAKPAEGEAKPAGGEAKPAEAEAKPAAK